MPKILVLYYSRTGNTEKMAQAVAEGAKTVSDVDVERRSTKACNWGYEKQVWHGSAWTSTTN